ncbi:MAG: NAD(P)-dependent oxidoreductase [Verrucomicrobia bacterium]|nr:MAG: NAD(P)-dependent oxidoreductase [Verrucomicrobiota bacterium]
MKKDTIGFIGLGIMGRSMAANLMKAGYVLQVYNRTRAKADELVAAGARWCETPAEAARGAGVVITIVGYPRDVRDVYLGEHGVLSAAAPGTVCIDMTTSSPVLAKEIAAAGAERRVPVLDAPVSGGDVGAREARLSIMVGGERDAFEKVRPIFEVMGKNIVYQGGPGAGQHTKMCNQIAVAASMLGVCEALVYARANGLDQQRVLDSIASGAAGSWSLSNLAPRVLRGDFQPGFMIKHFRKDLGIALEAAREAGLDLPMTRLAAELYEKTGSRFGEELGTQALYLLYSEGES